MQFLFSLLNTFGGVYPIDPGQVKLTNLHLNQESHSKVLVINQLIYKHVPKKNNKEKK